MSILDAAHKVLLSADPSEKVKAAYHWFDQCQAEFTVAPLTLPLEDHPARPERPVSVDPSQLKRRRLGSVQGRCALFHAVAHIELNAIDLAADMACRFALDPRFDKLDRQKFISDWAKVCAEEAKHFSLARQHLQDMGSDYGELPAHGGLWASAIKTSHSISARLAIAPMVLEARGLDVTPQMIEKLSSANDPKGVAVLKIIYEEEVGHVKIGTDWFHHIAQLEDKDAKDYFRALVNEFFHGSIKPPFNIPARELAGLEKSYYMGLER